MSNKVKRYRELRINSFCWRTVMYEVGATVQNEMVPNNFVCSQTVSDLRNLRLSKLHGHTTGPLVCPQSMVTACVKHELDSPVRNHAAYRRRMGHRQ